MPEKAIENKNKKRGLKVAAIAGGLVLVGGVAFAYWTQGGTGTGEASTGHTAAITVYQDSDVEGLAPGLDPQDLSGHFSNPNSGPVYVANLKVTISSIDSDGPCDPTDYVLSNGTNTGTSVDLPIGHEVPAGTGGTWSGVTIAFNNKPTTNQDGCKDATVNLAYVAS